MVIEEKLARKEIIEKIGQVGEKIIRNYLSKLKGVRVEDSLNLYDSEKDAVIEVEIDDSGSATIQATYINEDGKTVILKTIEIKTCTPYIHKKSVTIRKKHIKKCQEVDELYFVTVPLKNFWYKYSGWILKVDPKSFKGEAYLKRDIREPGGTRWMYSIPIAQEAVIRVRKLYKSELVQLLKFSTQPNLSQQDINELVEEYGDDDPIKRMIN